VLLLRLIDRRSGSLSLAIQAVHVKLSNSKIAHPIIHQSSFPDGSPWLETHRFASETLYS
jgi:hypothetical protein